MNNQLLQDLQKTLLEPVTKLSREQQNILDSSVKYAVESAKFAPMKSISESARLASKGAMVARDYLHSFTQTLSVNKLAHIKSISESARLASEGATAIRDYLNSLTKTLRENHLVHTFNSSLVNLNDLTKYPEVTERLIRPLSDFEEQVKAMNVAALGYDAVHLTAFSAVRTVAEQLKFVQANLGFHNQLSNSSLYHFLTDLDELNSEEFETEEDKFKALVAKVEVVFQTLLEKIQDNPSDFVLRVGYHVLITFIYPLILFSLSASNQQVQQVEQTVDDVHQMVQETQTQIEEQNRRLERMEKQITALATSPNHFSEPKVVPPVEREDLYRLMEDVQVQAEPSEHSPAIMTLAAGEIVKLLIQQGEWVKIQFFDYLHWELTTGWIQKSSLEHLMPRMSDSPRPFRTGQEVHPSLQLLAAKLHEVGIPLREYTREPIYRGPRTGLNRAFVMNAETRAKLITQDPTSADLIKPWMRCRDLRKWRGDWANRYVLMIKPGTPMEQYPALQQHLAPFREALETRNSAMTHSGQWFETPVTSVLETVLQRPKIIYPVRSSSNQFALDEAGFIPSQKCGIIPSDDLYLLAVLNSVLVTVWFRTMLPFTENWFIAKVSLMNHLPIAPATVAQQAPIMELVKNLLSTPWTVGAIALEQEIDSLLFKLYDLTVAEIALLTEFQRPPLCGIWAGLPEFDRDD